jgi:DNA-binding NarL/FixJ family response regulator
MECQHAMQLFRAGADGYVTKDQPLHIVLDAIHIVARGGRCIPAEIAEAVAVNLTKQTAALSHREYQVFYLLSSGLAVKEVADRLSLSSKTISTYRFRVLDKLGLSNNAEMMKYAITSGIHD